MRSTRALLLCAGKGTRLGPIGESWPKCLMPIHGKPLLEYWLESLTQSGIENILVNLHHRADQVEAFIRSSQYSCHVSVVREDSLLGTGGTLLANKGFFANETALIAHADNLSVFDPRCFLARHQDRPAGAEITLMTFEAQDPSSCGIVELDVQGLVIRFHEKVSNPPGKLANAAVYLVEPSLLDFLASLGKREIDFSTEVLPHYMGRIFTFHNEIYHRDIGTPQSLIEAQFDFPGAARGAPAFARALIPALRRSLGW